MNYYCSLLLLTFIVENNKDIGGVIRKPPDNLDSTLRKGATCAPLPVISMAMNKMAVWVYPMEK